MNKISGAILRSRTLIWNGLRSTSKLSNYASLFRRPPETTSSSLIPRAALSQPPRNENRNLLTPKILNLYQSRSIHVSPRMYTPRNVYLNCLTPKKMLNLNLSRSIHSSPKSFVPKTPDLIYFPDVLRWLKTKIKFKYLKTMWDPTFSEGAFIYGSTQAVCRITEIINNNQVAEFEGLLTPSARMKLIEDMRKKLSRTQKEIIRLHPRDIKILVPMSVDLKNNGIEKECKVMMRVLALKWYPQKSGYLRLVLVALQSEFSKDYTHGVDQDWNISGFEVMECTVLAETPSNTL